MAKPKAELNRWRLAEDVIAIAGMIDDMRRFPVGKPNRKKRLLCYSLVLFEILMWETFIEDLVDEGQDFMLTHVADPKKFGFDVLLPVSAGLSERKDKRAIWDIAGDQWKLALKASREALIAGFNTPRPSNVDALVLQTIGLKSISSSWHWKNASNAKVKKKINDLITMRGAIAHNMLSVPTIHFQTYVSRLAFTRRACEITSNHIRTHIHSIVGIYPWDRL